MLPKCRQEKCIQGTQSKSCNHAPCTVNTPHPAIPKAQCKTQSIHINQASIATASLSPHQWTPPPACPIKYVQPPPTLRDLKRWLFEYISQTYFSFLGRRSSTELLTESGEIRNIYLLSPEADSDIFAESYPSMSSSSTFPSTPCVGIHTIGFSKPAQWQITRYRDGECLGTNMLCLTTSRYLPPIMVYLSFGTCAAWLFPETFEGQD